MANQSDTIQRASKALSAGEVVVFPTETVYCVGADFSNRNAIARIFEAKIRPKSGHLIVHIADPADLRMLADKVPSKAQILIERFWPGALTIILPRKSICTDIVCARITGMALRLPSNPIAHELIKRAGRPVVAASAAIWGDIGPTCIEHVKAALGDACSVFIDDGPCTIGIETTIVSFMDENPVLLRVGAIPRDQIEAAIGTLQIADKTKHAVSLFPAMTDHHYEQKTVMMFGDQITQLSKDLRTGIICFQSCADTEKYNIVEVLSQKGCLEEAARNLYSTIRKLNALDLDLIAVQRVPDIGLGIAINDRLARVCCI
jgi:L-threonylcarbamoyladenylate synthase